MVTPILNGRADIGQLESCRNPTIHRVLNTLRYGSCEFGRDVQSCVPSENRALSTVQGANLNPNVSVHTEAAPLSNDFSVGNAGVLHRFTIEGAIESVVHRATCPQGFGSLDQRLDHTAPS